MGEIVQMGQQGDSKLIWDRNNHDEVEAARRMFKDLRGKGFLAFSVKGKDGEKDIQIHEFDPNAGRIIMALPMRGGACRL